MTTPISGVRTSEQLPDIYVVHWTDSKGSWFEQELGNFPTPADVPPGAVRMDVALSVVGRQTVFPAGTGTK